MFPVSVCAGNTQEEQEEKSVLTMKAAHHPAVNRMFRISYQQRHFIVSLPGE